MRIVPASELHAEALNEDEVVPAEARDGAPVDAVRDGEEFDILDDRGHVIMKSNRFTIDDAARQTLTMEEIEELKRAGTGSGKELIAKIMASHRGLNEKTAFSLAKYTLRKSKKYLRRFTILPLDVGLLARWILREKDPGRVMEIREEGLGLVAAWANIHHSIEKPHCGRWLVVDDTGGLIVALMAERMGILYENTEEDEAEEDLDRKEEGEGRSTQHTASAEKVSVASSQQTNDIAATNGRSAMQVGTKSTYHRRVPAPSTHQNTITVIHPAAQPNLSLLSYFNYDTSATKENTSHPLHTHLKSLSFLSLLAPLSCPDYQEPPIVSDGDLKAMKSGKRGAYWRKRRRWERVKGVVDETREGGFDGLVVASAMDLSSILRHTVQLVKGGGQVVVYSPTVEPLTEVMDLYSRDRRTAYLNRQKQSGRSGTPAIPNNTDTSTPTTISGEGASLDIPAEIDPDFPLNPTLLLAPTLHTSFAQQWQVLPERSHPNMTARGGAEGFVLSATRVVPSEGRVEARGKYQKRRKITAVRDNGDTMMVAGDDSERTDRTSIAGDPVEDSNLGVGEL